MADIRLNDADKAIIKELESGRGTATTHREKSVPAQMTLTAYEESKPSASVHETKSREPTRTSGSGDDD